MCTMTSYWTDAQVDSFSNLFGSLMRSGRFQEENTVIYEIFVFFHSLSQTRYLKGAKSCEESAEKCMFSIIKH